MPKGDYTFLPKRPDTKFIIRNITSGRDAKTIHLFTYPIGSGKERDLLAIPFVSESDIRHSLLKGELRIKGENREYIVVDSNIDLLQFDNIQKSFLQSIGIINGLEVAATSTSYIFKQGVVLGGAINDVNTIFTTSPDKFLDGAVGSNNFNIMVQHNGRILVKGIDYTISESGGVGTGYDTITIVTFIPATGSTMIADYMMESA